MDLYGPIKHLTVRLPDDVHARLITQADADRRSLNIDTHGSQGGVIAAPSLPANGIPQPSNPVSGGISALNQSKPNTKKDEES